MKVWIARDADGGLFMYDKKPKRTSSFFFYFYSGETAGIWPIPENHLPHVTWENSPKEYMVAMDIYELKAQIKKGGVNS